MPSPLQTSKVRVRRFRLKRYFSRNRLIRTGSTEIDLIILT
ncbi:hypothetical protein SRM1_02721 [Pseudomonas fluorescens]|nr:hypothetical protein SRM1_02721 [Pseudomonas fluorescens]